MSVAEQRYQAVLAVIGEGRTIIEVAGQWGVSRQTVHAWLVKYEAGGLAGLADCSRRPKSCPHQMSPAVEAAVLEMRRVHPYWGPRRIAWELAKRRLVADAELPSESGVYRCLVRAGVVDPASRQRRDRKWKRWERGRPNELWQMDLVGGFLLADGNRAKALTGVDDHSRFCVSARLMSRERTQPVCDGLAAAMRAHGVPEQILTDNGRVFTGRFNHPPVEVLFDRICRENGVEHLLTAPRSPTTTGKIERFHRALRTEFDTRQVFGSLQAAQDALDEWVAHYNTERPHRALEMEAPASRFAGADGGRADTATTSSVSTGSGVSAASGPDRTDDGWVSRRVATNGVVCVGWQQVSVGKHRAGANCDVLVTDDLLQFWVGSELLKTVQRTSSGEVRKKRASVPGGRG
jgi:transposase InsO family protein